MCEGIEAQEKRDRDEGKRLREIGLLTEACEIRTKRRMIAEVGKMLAKVDLSKSKDLHEDNEAEKWWNEENEHQDREFFDDVTGLPLKPELVKRARKEEMEFFARKRVYDRVARKTVKGKIIGVRWVDINKGDDLNPDHRSRLVAKEIGRDKRLDLFAATPQLETVRYILSRCARRIRAGEGDTRLMVNDVRRAYFFAKAQREIHVSLPEEDKAMYQDSEDMVGRLRLSMYGTRDAAQNWAREYTTTLLGLGFVQRVASPCHF